MRPKRRNLFYFWRNAGTTYSHSPAEWRGILPSHDSSATSNYGSVYAVFRSDSDSGPLYNSRFRQSRIGDCLLAVKDGSYLTFTKNIVGGRG